MIMRLATHPDEPEPALRCSESGAPTGRSGPAGRDEALVEAVFDELELGIFVLAGPNGPVVHANRAARHALGGLGLERRLPPGLATAVATALDQRLTGIARAVAATGPAGERFFLAARPLPDTAILVTITRARARARALSETLRRRHGLSLRECEILLYARDGLRNRDIARELGVSVHAVKKSLSRGYRRLGVHRRAELVGVLDAEERLDREDRG